MVDILALAISHGLLLVAAWRLLWRADLDSEEAEAARPKRGAKVRMRVSTAEPDGPDA